MKRSVLFLHRYGPQMASFRYRTAMPAEQVSKINGFTVGVNEPGEYDVIVASKPCEADLPLIEQGKKDGARILVDFADDHFKDSLSQTYYRMAELADGIVTASPVMRDRLKDYLRRDAFVVADPYEQPESEPHAGGEGKPDLLWFGHMSNLADLTSVTGQLRGQNLRVVSGPREIPNVIPWTPENMVAAFRQTNIVILPTREGAEFKSPNRLINSLRAGCFAVCMPHPSYREFRDFVWVGQFYTGLQWSEAFRADLNACVKAGQDYIRERYSPEAIGQQWAKVLEAL